MDSVDFGSFHDKWLAQLRDLVRQISSESTDHQIRVEEEDEEERAVEKLLERYSEYYRVKSGAVDKDVLGIFASPWASSLERSLHWVAGWRPTTAFHLFYTQSSLLFESHILDILRGHRTGDLGDLSPAQFRRVSELQCETVREENAITEELSDWQLQSGSELASATVPDVDGMFRRLGEVVKKADNLRLKTLRSMVVLLTPKQALEFLIAAVELQFGVHQWGKDRERDGEEAA